MPVVTIQPMMVLPPVSKTSPAHFHWMTKVELRARLQVSIALFEVDMTILGFKSLVEHENKGLKK